MGYVDTGLNIPESLKTLLAQQAQLQSGKRHVQMFPLGTGELPLSNGNSRHQNSRGVFHFRPDAITEREIEALSARGRENEFLNLGPFDKTEIAARMEHGEALIAITEFTPDGVELRTAAATASTLPKQSEYFKATKEDANTIEVMDMATLLIRRLS